jgi:hypothetical protein
MKKLSNKSESVNGEKFSQELRGQPRKSQNYAPKHVSTHAHHHQDDDRELHHHHHEPGKNAVRMQLRSIQRFF